MVEEPKVAAALQAEDEDNVQIDFAKLGKKKKKKQKKKPVAADASAAGTSRKSNSLFKHSL